MASGGWGAPPPRPPLWHVLWYVLYPSPLHQGMEYRPPSVSSGGRSQLTQNPYARKSQMFTTVASGGWGLRPPDPPYGMCLSCNQVLARPGLHLSSGTLAGGWARALISETNRGGTHSVRKNWLTRSDPIQPATPNFKLHPWKKCPKKNSKRSPLQN